MNGSHSQESYHVRAGARLSELLRDGTAAAHRATERSEFVARFVQGRLDRALYTRHLHALHGVYAALEDGLELRKDDPRLGAFALPQLWRRVAIERDLDFLRGPAWRTERPGAASLRYAERLRALSDTEPLRLVAHAYVRYLGDLSGGQVLRRLASQQLGLEGDGRRFYEFPAIPDPPAFKAAFRRRLDDLEVTLDERGALLEEANAAFALNAAIFEELVRGGA